MLLIYGQKSTRIGAFSEHQQQCKHCGAFDMSVAVFRNYFHLFYLPVLPVGPKTTKSWCHNCGQPYGDVAIDTFYEKKARTPIYFYSLSLLIGGLVAWGVISNYADKRAETNMVQHPKIGDIYLIRDKSNDSTTYYFMKVTAIEKDMITVNHGSLMYYSYTSSPALRDSFVTAEPLIYHQAELNQMRDDNEIEKVNRDTP